MNVFAAFIIARHQTGFAATTRVGGDAVGFPGGKLDAGESPREAALREAREEGWQVVQCDDLPCHRATVDGRLVVWFAGRVRGPKMDFKEKGRIAPAVARQWELTGFGNEAAMAEFLACESADPTGAPRTTLAALRGFDSPLACNLRAEALGELACESADFRHAGFVGIK